MTESRDPDSIARNILDYVGTDTRKACERLYPLIEEVRHLCMDEPNIVTTSIRHKGRLIIIGDLHGLATTTEELMEIADELNRTVKKS